jgi:hypothetical protein
MPLYDVYYYCETQYMVRIEADSYEEACVHWPDPAYWVWNDAEVLSQDMIDTDVTIEEAV